MCPTVGSYAQIILGWCVSLIMDIDRLITMVFERPSLWDKYHKLHGDRNIITQLWKEISSEMNEDETKLRKKWRYLRDQFSLETKLQATRSTTPKWPYYNSLLFLKDFVHPRKQSKNLVRAISYPPVHTEDIDEVSDSQESHDNPTSHNVSSPTLRSYEDHLTSIQCSSKLKRSQKTCDENDEHLFFFKSLLPHVRKIPQHKILSFRNRIQTVAEEFAYQSQTAHESRYVPKAKSSKLSGKRRAHETIGSPEYLASTLSDTDNVTIKEEFYTTVEDDNQNE